MTNIMSINQRFNVNLETIIKFLDVHTSKDRYSPNSLAVGGVLLTTPHVILTSQIDIKTLHEYIAGRIAYKLKEIQDALIAINKGDLKQHELSNEIFKDFCDDLKEGKPFVTLTIPFADEVIAINYVFIAGHWFIVNLWSNDISLIEAYLRIFLQRSNVDRHQVFNIDIPKDVRELVGIINNQGKIFSPETINAAFREYQEQFEALPRGNLEQEYPIQVIYDFGLRGDGNTNDVTLSCESTHHEDGALFGTYQVLPYSMKDGSANKLLCHACASAEREDILNEHPEFANYD